MTKRAKSKSRQEALEARWQKSPTEIGFGFYLAVVAFVAGAAVMIVELAASRVLAPYFGNTLYTWTAVIGVILLALSIGYYSGGRFADHRPVPHFLLHLITAAGLFVLIVPALIPAVTATLAPEGRSVNLVWGPMVAALLLFAVPAILLGAVAPFAVKLLSLQSHNERVGAASGLVSMLFTVGSVLGTFAAGFLLIPMLGVKAIFLTVGITLVVAAALGYVGLVGARSLPAAAVAMLLAAIFGAVAYSSDVPRRDNVVFQTDTLYHHISILRMNAPDGRGVTFLLTDGAPQGAQADSGERLVYAYNRFVRLEQLFCPSVERAAFLGGGAYSMPLELADAHPQAHIDVVEIDPQVEVIARRWFRLDDYEGRIDPHIGDARRFLAAGDAQYDLIFGDVFRGRQIVPPHLATREFFTLVRRRLKDDGVYMMNLMGAVEGPRSGLFRAIAATLREVFPELYVFTAYPDTPRDELQNLVLVAPVQPRGWTNDDLIAMPQSDDESLAKLAGNLMDMGDIDLSGMTVLTDDFSPVEFLAARQLRE